MRTLTSTWMESPEALGGGIGDFPFEHLSGVQLWHNWDCCWATDCSNVLSLIKETRLRYRTLFAKASAALIQCIPKPSRSNVFPLFCSRISDTAHLDPLHFWRRLEITLPSRVAGNLVLVKLIDQEDLMHEWDDQHDDPNIDINHVIFSGCTLHLPPGVALST